MFHYQLQIMALELSQVNCDVFLIKVSLGAMEEQKKIQLELVCICAISFVQNWELVLISNRKLEFIQLFCYTSPKAIT